MNARTLSLLGLALLPILGGAARAQEGAAEAPAPGPLQPAAWSADERASIELLRSLRKKERPSDDELAARLSRGGERVLPLLFQVLSARAVPALEEGDAPQVLSEIQEHAVLLAVAELERSSVLALVSVSLALDAEPRRRNAALACVGAVGRANDLLQMFELAFGARETEPDERLLKTLRRAVSAVLVRDPRALEQLISVRRITRIELLPTLVAAAGATRDPRMLAYLSEIAYWHEGLILDVMSQVSLLGPSGDEAVDGAMKVRLRAYLNEEHPGPCRGAITALTALGDEQALAPLIELLKSPNEGLVGNAHWALKQLTGLALAPETEPWARWHQAELYWQVRKKSLEFQRLRESDPATAADALRSILTHPLARRDLVAALPDLLKSRFPQIRVLACSTLGSLGARDAVGKLVWALEDEDAGVSQAAHAALRVLTKLDLPREPVAWQAATNTQPRGAEL